MKTFTLLLFLAVLLSGCGQKGDLYLPAEKTTPLLDVR